MAGLKRSAEEMQAGGSGGGVGSGDDALWSTSFTRHIENSGTLTSEPSAIGLLRGRHLHLVGGRHAAVAHRYLKVCPLGYNAGQGTHLSVSLVVLDGMWEPTAEFKLTVVNQARASESCSSGGVHVFTSDQPSCGPRKFIELSALKAAAAGWLVNDTLLVKVDVTVARGPLSGGHRWRTLNPRDPEPVMRGGGPHQQPPPPGGLSLLPRRPGGCERQHPDPVATNLLTTRVCPQVDGSLGTWTYIQSCLYLLHDQPDLTLPSVYALLPVVHKYDFTKLLGRLVAFVKGKREELSADPGSFRGYVIKWLALAERLQLDELRDLCLDKLRSMTGEGRQDAITVEVEVGSGGDN
ncbi:hypothetical protein FOA52_015078 [Chlamydomonas sp. UWO 241]|nr:hypothetical protein FOA52_015078 [Chlamydomonas sp. UWO 241]